MTRGLLLFWVSIFVIAGCASKPTQQVIVGDLLQHIDFGPSSIWQEYVRPEQHVDFEIKNGFYEAKAWNGGFMWTIEPPDETDTIIDVVTTQLSDYRNNAYGVMCRALPTDNGDGYFFLISGDGQYTIRRGAVDNIHALIPFTPSSAIHQDKTSNKIRAVCIGTYLALYVNDTFVAETHDDYFKTGYTGLTVAVVKGSDATADITFDDLSISKGTLAQ